MTAAILSEQAGEVEASGRSGLMFTHDGPGPCSYLVLTAAYCALGRQWLKAKNLCSWSSQGVTESRNS
eukprot:352987-Chlamydomonas_euryale.AAC.12